VPLAGGVLSFLFWPRPLYWKRDENFRMALFLFLLFWGLFFMHAIASVGQEYCVFCLTPYTAFFNTAGILFIVVSMKSWDWNSSSWKVFVPMTVFLLAVFTAVGFSAFEDIGSALLKLPVPRMREMRILPGFVTLFDILSGKFQINYNTAMKYASAAFGFGIGALLLAVVCFVWFRARPSSVGVAPFTVSAILLLSMILSPVAHGSAAGLDCSSDVIADNKRIGDHLRQIIPAGSSVYWDGGLSAAPLLYLPGVKLFPAQINSAYSFISNGDTAELYRFGFWNEEMRDEWKATADFFLIEEKRYDDWKAFFVPGRFDEFAPSPVGTSCLKDTRLRIFRRN
jgi:hypothetical protein